jgi:hypothetical protein
VPPAKPNKTDTRAAERAPAAASCERKLRREGEFSVFSFQFLGKSLPSLKTENRKLKTDFGARFWQDKGKDV